MGARERRAVPLASRPMAALNEAINMPSLRMMTRWWRRGGLGTPMHLAMVSVDGAPRSWEQLLCLHQRERLPHVAGASLRLSAKTLGHDGFRLFALQSLVVFALVR